MCKSWCHEKCKSGKSAKPNLTWWHMLVVTLQGREWALHTSWPTRTIQRNKFENMQESTNNKEQTKRTAYTRILETREPAWISCWQPANPVTSMQTHWNQAWTRRGGIVYAVLSRYTYCICTAIKVQKILFALLSRYKYCKCTALKVQILFALLSRYKKWNWPWEAKTLWVQSFAHLPIWWRGWSAITDYFLMAQENFAN